MANPLPIAAAVFAAGAFALSIAMLPGDHEIAAMDLRDQSYSAAVENFELAWRAGDRSEATLAQLARAYIGSGKVDEAIAAFQGFLADNPDHIQAKDALLATYYDGQRMDEYYRLLVALASEDKDVPRIRQAIEAAQDRQDVRTEALLLARLRDADKVNNVELRRLAWLQARFNAPDKALALLESLPRGEFTSDDALFAFRLALDLGDVDRAVRVAAPFVRQRDSGIQTAALFVDLLRAYGELQAAGGLLAALPQGDAPADRLARADLLLTIGDAAGAIAEARQAGLDAPDEATRRAAITTLIDAGDDETLAAVVASPDLTQLTPEHQATVIAALIDRSERAGADASLRQALAAIDPAALAANPALAARAAAAVGDRASARRHVRAALEAGKLDPETAVALAATAELIGDREAAQAAVRLFPSPAAATPATLEAMAGFHVRFGDAKAMLPAFSAVHQSRPSPASARAWARLAAAAGDPAAVTAWLLSAPQVAEPALIDIANAAVARGARDLAVAAMGQLAALKPTRQNRAYLAYLQHQLGDDAAALALLDALEPLSKDERALYTAAALRLGDPRRVASAVGADLKRGGAAAAGAIQALLASGNFALAEPTVRQRIAAGETDWLYSYGAAAKAKGHVARFEAFAGGIVETTTAPAVIEAAIAATEESVGLDAALALRAAVAARLGGTWAEAYEYALIESGRGAAAAANRLSRATRQGVPERERLEVADALVAQGRRDDAERLLRALAKRGGAYSTPTDRLVYLWGPRPPVPALSWVAARAKESKAPEERSEWLRRLAEIGGAATAFAMIVQNAAAATPAEALLAAETAPGLPDRAMALAGVRRLAEIARDPRALTALGDAAETFGDKQTAYLARAGAVRAQPNDAAALRAYGFAAASVGRKAEAYDALQRYVRLRPNDAEASMDLGYAAMEARRFADAAATFTAAARAFRQARRDETPARLAAADALRQAGQTDAALSALAALDRERPSDPRARAAYVEALLNAGKPEEARRALNR